MPLLNGRQVSVINSRLRPTPERPDPQRFKANAGLSFQGSIVLGMGFTLTPEERRELLKRDARNGERIFPYLGGEEVNSSPTQSHRRYVINFGQMSLEEAEAWPDLLAIVREKVKPERDRNRREVRRKYWWRFGEVAPALYDAIAPLKRCLVNSQVSKHLIFAWQPTGRVFGHTLYAYPVHRSRWLAVLQSRVHEPWARLLSSSLEDRLRYAASDCFETFPFPEMGADLDAIGKRLDEERRKLCDAREQGLTKVYNHMKDPACRDADVLALRELHEEMDRAVLSAYGWDDLEVPPYETPRDGAGERALQAFQDAVVDRLFALNAERAAGERRPNRSFAAVSPTDQEV